MNLEMLDRGATIDGPYRYNLWRTWDRGKPQITLIMLNPSTATDTVDDRTIKHCLDLAHAWQKGGIVVVNLFAWRAKNPKELLQAPSPIGPKNDAYIREAAEASTQIVAAWGPPGSLYGRDQEVLALLKELQCPIFCIAITKGGFPRHPLYTRKNAELLPYP